MQLTSVYAIMKIKMMYTFVQYSERKSIMIHTLERLRALLEKTGQTDRINSPVLPEDISAWETKHGVPIPEEICAFLLFSDGICCGMELINLRSLNSIFPSQYSRIVPHGWYMFGSLYYGSADLVSDENGRLFVSDRCGCDQKLKEFSLKAWINDCLFPYLVDDGIGKTLGYMRMLLEQADLTDRIQQPVSVQDISDWEALHHAVLPEEIRAFLQFSDGFQYRWGALDIIPLQEIDEIDGWDIVPDGWYSIGSVIGDGAELVSDPNGCLFLADHENHDETLRRISLKSWIEDYILEELEEDADADRCEVLITSGIWKPLRVENDH